MSSARANLPIFILAAVEIAIGIMLIINPVGFQFLLIRIIGIALMVLGVIFLIRFITGRKNPQIVDENGKGAGGSNPATLIIAIIAIAFGIICTFFTGWILGLFAFFAIVLGIFLVVFGILKIKNFVDRKKSQFETSPLSIIGAILCIIIGILVVVNPFGAANTIWIIAGVALIITAVVDILSMILGNGSKQFRDTQK